MGVRGEEAWTDRSLCLVMRTHPHGTVTKRTIKEIQINKCLITQECQMDALQQSKFPNLQPQLAPVASCIAAVIIDGQ